MSKIDWAALATIIAPLITLTLGAWWDRRGTRLISFYGQVAGINGVLPGTGQQIRVNTHTIVLRNTGRQPATNVRLTHRILPLFSVWPPVVHHVEDLPNGSKDVVMPILIPGEQVTIHYLYDPPMTVDQIHQGIKCDQGFAHPIRVLLRRQYPRWSMLLRQLLFFIGVGATAYWFVRAGRCVLYVCSGP